MISPTDKLKVNEEMYNSLLQMMTSTDYNDKQLARDIVVNKWDENDPETEYWIHKLAHEFMKHMGYDGHSKIHTDTEAKLYDKWKNPKS